MRAVIGSGGECKELLLKPSQSISVRFSAVNITHRLSAPITCLTHVPKGFFSDLVTSCLCSNCPNVTDEEVRQGGIPNSQYFSIAEAKRRQAIDLQSMTIAQIVRSPPPPLIPPVAHHPPPPIRFARLNTRLVPFAMLSTHSSDPAMKSHGSPPISKPPLHSSSNNSPQIFSHSPPVGLTKATYARCCNFSGLEPAIHAIQLVSSDSYFAAARCLPTSNHTTNRVARLCGLRLHPPL